MASNNTDFSKQVLSDLALVPQAVGRSVHASLWECFILGLSKVDLRTLSAARTFFSFSSNLATSPPYIQKGIIKIPTENEIPLVKVELQ